MSNLDYYVENPAAIKLLDNRQLLILITDIALNYLMPDWQNQNPLPPAQVEIFRVIEQFKYDSVEMQNFYERVANLVGFTTERMQRAEAEQPA